MAEQTAHPSDETLAQIKNVLKDNDALLSTIEAADSADREEAEGLAAAGEATMQALQTFTRRQRRRQDS